MTWTRRKALRSAASTLWLPMFPSLMPRSARAATPAVPQRLLIYFVANGLTVGDGSPPDDYDEYGILTPLDPMASRRLVVSGLRNKTVNSFSDHEPCTPALLSDVAPNNYSGPFDVGITADQFAAGQIGGETPFRSLQLGVNTAFEPISPNGKTYSARISWSNPTTPLPPTEVPKQLFDSMFAGYDPDLTEAEIDRRTELRKSVLDSVLDHVNHLETSLNPTDRTKLDQYTSSIRDLEQRIEDLQENTCAVPDSPASTLDYVATVEAFVDLMIIALECDFSRVMTFMSAPSSSYQVYDWLGHTRNHHVISHGWRSGADQDRLIGIQRWHTDVVNGMCTRLAAIQAEDGSDMLSNTLVVLTSEFTDPASHDSHPLPFVLLGGENGGVRQGRHMHLTGNPSHANMLRAMIQYVGADPGDFGPNHTETLDLS